TGLLNYTQPLVRYDIGDIGAISASGCTCGRDHLPVLTDLMGRVEDEVVGPDGRRMVRFHGIFVGLGAVVEGQVVQKAVDSFLVRVVAHGDIPPDEQASIRHRFAERLGPVRVHIERVREIPRGPNGKFRAVVCEIPPEQRPDRGELAPPSGA
ncbi:MAG TPA: hypothetical protein VLH79_04800, partial [Chthonomonadales bacterium]|nr:hypothetical protein [Chthonomonadales bacterium]